MLNLLPTAKALAALFTKPDSSGTGVAATKLATAKAAEIESFMIAE